MGLINRISSNFSSHAPTLLFFGWIGCEWVFHRGIGTGKATKEHQVCSAGNWVRSPYWCYDDISQQQCSVTAPMRDFLCRSSYVAVRFCVESPLHNSVVRSPRPSET